MFFPVMGARVLPTIRRPQVDQNNGVSGPTFSRSMLSTCCTYSCRYSMTAEGRGMSRAHTPFGLLGLLLDLFLHGRLVTARLRVGRPGDQYHRRNAESGHGKIASHRCLPP